MKTLLHFANRRRFIVFGLVVAALSSTALGQVPNPRPAIAYGTAPQSFKFGNDNTIITLKGEKKGIVNLLTTAANVQIPGTAEGLLFDGETVSRVSPKPVINSREGAYAEASGEMEGVDVLFEDLVPINIRVSTNGELTAISGPKLGAIATAHFIDPATFVVTAPGEVFEFSATLHAGTTFISNSPDASATTRFALHTDIDGLESLISIGIEATGADNGLSVTFTSNPALALDDSFLRAQLLSAFERNSGGDGMFSYTLNSDFVLPASFEIPNDIETFEIGFDSETIATAPFAPIPEPSIYGLCAIALLAVAAIIRSSRRRLEGSQSA